MAEAVAHHPAERALGELYGSTLGPLLSLRRFIPFVLVSVPLLLAQTRLSDHASALPVGILMCTAFLLTAPFLWRAFNPGAFPMPGAVTRLIGYAAAGALVVVGLGLGVPFALQMPNTFMTSNDSLTVVLGLFWVGGWGLGRDVENEIRLREATLRAQRARKELEQAQLLAIRSHLDPHFLFNTLNAIAEWCRDDGKVAEEAIIQLSEILRTILEGVKTDTWALEKEVALIGRVLELHRVRTPDAFDYTQEIDAAAASVPVPPLLLLPLVENAMKHGPSAGHHGEVSLRVVREGDRWILEIANPGPFQGPREGGEGLGLVRKRLDVWYGSTATFSIDKRDERTVATVTLPWERTP